MSLEEEEDPFFEMVFLMSQASLDSNKSDTVAFHSLSKSVESVCTLDSTETFSRSNRESNQVPSLPPERPKTLKILGLNLLKRDSNYTSLPTTPADSVQSSFTQDNGFIGKRDFSSSISSVEEAGLERPSLKRKSHKSRLSLNMNLSLSSSNVSPDSNKYPKLNIPSMLRASFSCLRSRDKNKTEWGKEPVSFPIMGTDEMEYSQVPRDRGDRYHIPSTPGIRCHSPSTQEIRCQMPTKSDCGASPLTPRTQAYINDMMARGLPIIPFADPTFALVERKLEEMKRNIRKNSMTPPPRAPPPTRSQSEEHSDLSPSSSLNNIQLLKFAKSRHGKPKLRNTKSAPESQKQSNVQKPSHTISLQQEPDNLQNVLNLAKAELEEEALTTKTRKRIRVRGYATNNSRALNRRRSSDNQYIKGEDFIEHLKNHQKHILQQRKLRKVRERKSKTRSENEENLYYLCMDHKFDCGKPTQASCGESEEPLEFPEKTHRQHGNLVEPEEDYLPMDCGSRFRTSKKTTTNDYNEDLLGRTDTLY